MSLAQIYEDFEINRLSGIEKKNTYQYIAYPFGGFNDDVVYCAKKYKYKLAFDFGPGRKATRDDSIYHIFYSPHKIIIPYSENENQWADYHGRISKKDLMKGGGKRMNRIAKWDNAKLILITLVVICHFYENYLGSSNLVNALFFSVYSFHMPAFFLISGLFAKRTVNERRVEKVTPYLLIYLFMKFLGWVVPRIVQGDGYVSIDFFRESGVSWFILALFFMYIITFYTKKYKPLYVLYLLFFYKSMFNIVFYL